ncbi:MAG TPA: ribonucleotide reductase N-terminal alpha domain-containing protein, partial [Gemmatimonadales bacterium]|nr:ribonucleotide reductase N-terminal alpha domain-containing protein [Gemmatimonadales bacterium]
MQSSTPRDAVRLSPNAITVLEKRYLLKDESGTPVESPRDLFWRVARTVARADERYGADAAKAEQVAGDF